MRLAVVGDLTARIEDMASPPVEPTSPRVRDVIFTLVRGGSNPATDYSMLKQSIACTRKAMRPVGPLADVVGFHEGNVPKSVASSVAPQIGSGFRFIDARIYGGFMLPKHLRNRLPKIRGPNVNTLGYRHMCRFFSMIWFVALRKYELAMRVDEDVCIHTLHHMPDPFAALRLNNAVYGYSAQTAEKHLPTTRSMQGWARSYMVEHAITPASRPVDVRRIYFTNFFLSSTSWWTEPRVSAFLDAVDRNGSTYTYRWGDAPIQSTALDLFAKREQLLFVPVDYTHISTNNEISYGIEVRFDRNEHEPSPQKKFMKAFESCFAPCAVANARQLQGFPFRTLSGSIRGLRRALAPALPEPDLVREYLEAELPTIVQHDLFGANGPLPADHIAGFARFRKYAALVLEAAGTCKAPCTDSKFQAVPSRLRSHQGLWRALLRYPCCKGRWWPGADAEAAKRQALRRTSFGKVFGRSGR